MNHSSLLSQTSVWLFANVSRMLAASVVLLGLALNTSAQLNADFTATPLSGSQPLVVNFTNTTTGGPGFAMWDFGDGKTSISQNPTHIYSVAQATQFTVSLTFLTATESDTETKVNFITVDPASIIVDFSASVESGSNPLTVSFSDLTPNGPFSSHHWDFGDGSTSNAVNPTHVFEAGQTTSFTVTLTIGLGMQSVMETKTDFITVQPAPIVTDFSADVTIGDPPLMVNFSDQTTGGVIDAWLWNFGDGNTSTTQNPTNVYQLPGNYDVTLTTFVGPQAEPHTKLAYINVNPTLALTAAFTADPTSGSNPLTVSFTNLSTGDLITGYLWDFGDGSTSTDTNPIHEYLVAGPTTFDVQLTAFSGIQTSVSNQPGLIDIGIPFISHLATTSLVNSETVEAIDIDGDGDLDFVAGSGGTNTVAWYENLDALGTFSAPRNMDASANTPIDLKGADFDGDGDQDVLALTLGDSRISWYENTDAQGNFGASNSIIQYPILTVPNVWKVGVADLDGDGDTDVISRGGWIANRDGLGGFGVENKVGFLRALFYAADVDLNGSLDLIRVFDDSQKADDTESIDWFRNSNGDGQFEYVAYIQQHYDNGNFPIGDHAVGDMDEDGYPDFVYTENLSLTVYQNKAETPVGFNRLNFGSLLVYPIPGSPASQLTELKLADMDGDGFLDVLAALKGSNRVAWRRNESGLQNLGATLFVTATALDPDGISTGDLNSDGDIDVFVADGAGNQVTWQENTLASPNWPYLGQGLAGDLGNPVLTGGGELSEGSNVNLRLTNANQNAPAVLVIGFSRIDIPILGGTLVPFPNFKQKGLLTDANGEIAWDLIWPPGLSPNTTLYFQCWVSDASGPQGLTASNGLSSASP